MSEETRKTGSNETPRIGWSPYLPSGNGAQPLRDGVVWNLALWSLIVSVAVTVIWATALVEKRLDKESRARLVAAGIEDTTLNLRWDYRDLAVYGELPPGITTEQVTEALQPADATASRTFMARGIRNLIVSADPAAPLPISIIPEELPELGVTVLMQRGTATLDGVVESVEQRRVLVDALLATGVEIIHDNLDVSDLDDAVPVVDAKVDVLAEMLRSAGVEGVARFYASLDRRKLDYEVSTLDRETAVAVESAASVAIIDFDISGEATVAQNAMVNVSVNSDSNTLTLDGHVFSEEQHRRLAFAAKEATDGVKKVVDNVSVSPLAAIKPGSDARVEGLAEIVTQFKTGVSGQVQMLGNELSLDAWVESDQARISLQEVAASAREQGLVVQEHIVIGDDARLQMDHSIELQLKLDELADEVLENVSFNSGNAVLTSDSRFTLDRVERVLNAYPEITVEIEGHTDNVGRELVNEELSMDRAAAVRQYLIERSVAATRLVAVGYGSRRPLVSNDTSEGRKKNRRVHFHVAIPQLAEMNEE